MPYTNSNYEKQLSDYANQISQQQSRADASYQTYNQYAQQADEQQKKYQALADSAQKYEDIYKGARDQYVDTDKLNAMKNTYQTARSNVDMVNAQIQNMPDAVRQQYGNTLVSAAARQRAQAAQMAQAQDALNAYNTSYQNAYNDYNTEYARALNEAQNVASGNYQQQEGNIDRQQQDWYELLNQRAAQYGLNQQDVAALNAIKADQAAAQRAYANWQQQQEEMERKLALQEQQNRYQNYLAQQQLNAQKAQSEAARRQQYEAAKTSSSAYKQWLLNNSTSYANGRSGWDNWDRNMAIGAYNYVNKNGMNSNVMTGGTYQGYLDWLKGQYGY